MKKKIALFLVAAMTVATFAACGAKDTPASAPKEESTSEGEDTPTEDKAPAEGGSVAVFYYTYGDTYISSVRVSV